MNSTRRTILFVLPLLAGAIALWLLVVSPKRQEATDLEAQAADLRAQVEEQEMRALTAEQARQDFSQDYRRVVVLGKAAPEDDDTSSFLVQLDRISRDAGVKFLSLTTEAGADAPEPPPAEGAPQTPAATAQQDEQRVENVDGTPAAPAPATEAQAALLPIGAAIGPAGLPVMHYSLSFEGDFFALADFIAGLDRMVRTSDEGDIRVSGRLVTVDGFDLSPIAAVGEAARGATTNPRLSADFTITTYITPADEGATGGASPTGPAPATSPQPVSGSATPPSTATAATTTP